MRSPCITFIIIVLAAISITAAVLYLAFVIFALSGIGGIGAGVFIVGTLQSFPWLHTLFGWTLDALTFAAENLVAAYIILIAIVALLVPRRRRGAAAAALMLVFITACTTASVPYGTATLAPPNYCALHFGDEVYATASDTAPRRWLVVAAHAPAIALPQGFALERTITADRTCGTDDGGLTVHPVAAAVHALTRGAW